jgi:micrococcal nuclease
MASNRLPGYRRLPWEGWAMRKLAGMLTAALVFSGAEAVSPCAGEAEVVSAHIVRVEKNGALILKDGRAAMLEGIRLPDAALDREIAAQASAALDGLAKGRLLDLHAVWPKEDRYDRIRTQVFDEDGVWLQTALLEKGLARVDLAPDRSECNAELYAAEAKARNAHRGLWALPAYAVRNPQHPGPVGTFQAVAGRVLDAAIKDGRAFLNFGEDWKTDFTVTISPDDMKTFRRMKVDPLQYRGRMVRVRGIIQSYNGPEIEIGNPKQIELLE